MQRTVGASSVRLSELFFYIFTYAGVGRVSSPRYTLRFSDADQPFGLRVDSRGANGAVPAWDSMDMPLVFKDQYIQVTSRWAHAHLATDGIHQGELN